MTPLRYREIIQVSLLLAIFAGASALDGRYEWTAWWLFNAVGVLRYG